MPQVKKLQSGGDTPPSITGKFRIQGRELVGQAALDEVARLSGFADAEDREAYSVASRAIQDGRIVEYDPYKNQVYVWDEGNNNIFTDYSDVDASFEDSKGKRVLDALANNRANRFKRGAQYFARANMLGTPEKKSTSKQDKIKLEKGDGKWFYLKDDKIDPNSLRNQNIKAQITKLQGYFTDSDKDTLNDRYDTSAYGNNGLAAFTNVYNSWDSAKQTKFWEDLLKGIDSSDLNDAQKEALAIFGYLEGEDDIIKGPKPGEQGYIDESFTTRYGGNKDALSKAGFGFYIKDGKPYVAGDSKN